MIKVSQLKKSFRAVNALRGVDLDFKPGLVTGILGPNGCGKTTLIKSILGLVVPDDGVVTVNDVNINKNWDYRRQIGYMPQNSHFPGNLKAAELFSMIEDIQGHQAPLKEELIDLFEVRQYLHKPIGQLSGGTRQKVSAVMAFMFEPPVLILDEPTVGLDPIAVVRLKKLIAEVSKKGATVILVTHMMAEIEQLVDEMYFILDGKIKFSGQLEQIRRRAEVEDLEEAIVKLMSEGYRPGDQL